MQSCVCVEVDRVAIAQQPTDSTDQALDVARLRRRPWRPCLRVGWMLAARGAQEGIEKWRRFL
jgi:hypothetical protein